MMKYRLILLIIGFSIMFASCMQPYKNLAPLEFSELDYPFDVHYAELDNGKRIAYVDEGSGRDAIIFVHGLGSYLKAWHKNVSGLKDDFRCIAVDLPGYGKSSKELHSGSMEFYGDVLVELMETLDIDQATIAGHSMGGQIAMVMALKHPERVKRLILIAPAGFEPFTEGEKEWFREVMTVDGVKLTSVQQIRANVVANFYNMPDDAEFMITDRIALRDAGDFDRYCYTVVKSVEGMVNQPVNHLLGKIEQPALIIFGENDNLIPNPYLNGGSTAGIAEIGAAQLPDNTLLMIPNCGHFAQFEKPDVVNQAVSDFMKK